MKDLSPREWDILRLLRDGKSNKEIAAELMLSPNTVKTNLQSMFSKLDVSNRTAAVMAVEGAK